MKGMRLLGNRQYRVRNFIHAFIPLKICAQPVIVSIVSYQNEVQRFPIPLQMGGTKMRGDIFDAPYRAKKQVSVDRDKN